MNEHTQELINKIVLMPLHSRDAATLVKLFKSLDYVKKVERKINGNLINELWDATNAKLKDCKLLVAKALGKAKYTAYEEIDID